MYEKLKKRVDVWLNGRSLRALDAIIEIPKIDEQAPQTDVTYGDNPGGDGQRLILRRRTNRRVLVTFQIRELYDLARRAAILDAVNAWAQDGWLELSYRPGKRLRVYCTGRPAMGLARDVLAEYTVEFEAVRVPFWEDALPVTANATGTTATMSLSVPGTAPTVLTARLTPSAALTSFSIAAGDSAFSFTGLTVAADTMISVDYDADGYLTVKAGSTSILDKRAAASSDELRVRPGVASIAVEADASCVWAVSARGRWL